MVTFAPKSAAANVNFQSANPVSLDSLLTLSRCLSVDSVGSPKLLLCSLWLLRACREAMCNAFNTPARRV